MQLMLDKNYDEALKLWTKIQEETTMKHGSVSRIVYCCLFHRTECFIALGKKKEASKSFTLFKRYTSASGPEVLVMEEKIASMPLSSRGDDQHAEKVTTRMKCSNPTCTQVESHPREFNMCARCKAAKVLQLEVPKGALESRTQEVL